MATGLGGSAPAFYFLCGIPSLAVFLLWSRFLMSGRQKVPARSFVLFIALALASLTWLRTGWSFGLKYQGRAYTEAMLLYNLTAISIVGIVWVRNWRAPSYVSNLVFHGLLFGWLAFCAFPGLGELP